MPTFNMPSTVGIIVRISFAALFIIIIGLGAFGLFTIPKAVAAAMNKIPVLTNSGDSLEGFRNSSVITYVSHTFFNLTNGDDVTAKGAVPSFKSVGPYTYRKQSTKFDINFQDDNGTVQSKGNTVYIWDAEHSIDGFGNQLFETDIIIQMNTPLYGLTAAAKQMCDAGEKTLWSMLGPLKGMTKSSLFQTRPVSEFLWGANYALLGAIGKNPFFTLFQRNSSDAMPSERYTGATSLDLASVITMYLGMRTLPFWAPGSISNRVTGSQGNYLPNNQVTSSSVLSMWLSPIYRAGSLIFKSYEKLFSIKVLRFVIDPKLGDPNPDTYQTMKGFIPFPPALQIPLVYSFPYFMQADMKYVNVEIDGYNPPKPNPAIHEMYADVEPMTGMTIRGANRIQTNFWLAPRMCNGTAAAGEANLPTTWWPFVYVDEYASASEEQANKLAKVYSILALANALGLAGFIIGIVGFIGVVVAVIVTALMPAATAPKTGQKVVKGAKQVAVVPEATPDSGDMVQDL